MDPRTQCPRVNRPRTPYLEKDASNRKFDRPLWPNPWRLSSNFSIRHSSLLDSRKILSENLIHKGLILATDCFSIEDTKLGKHILPEFNWSSRPNSRGLCHLSSRLKFLSKVLKTDRSSSPSINQPRIPNLEKVLSQNSQIVRRVSPKIGYSFPPKVLKNTMDMSWFLSLSVTWSRIPNVENTPLPKKSTCPHDHILSYHSRRLCHPTPR